MASSAATCRQKANECAGLASNVADPYSRAQLKETAALWRQMAQSVETLGEIARTRATAGAPGVGTMSRRAKPRADLSMTLGDMRELGVHEINVLCLNPACEHEMTFRADDYAEDIELSWFRPRMVCARCSDRRLDVQPNF
jgi:hypothetical protein